MICRPFYRSSHALCIIHLTLWSLEFDVPEPPFTSHVWCLPYPVFYAFPCSSDLLQSLQSQLDQLTRSLLTSGLGSLPISTPSPSDAMSMDPTPSAAAATGGDLVSSLPDTMDAFCESLQEGLRENFGKRQSVREVGAIVEGVLKS